MPLFDYKCLECGAVFELLVGSSAFPEDLKCVECGSVSLERLLAVPAVPQMKQGGSRKGAPCGDTPCCGRETRCDRPPCGS